MQWLCIQHRLGVQHEHFEGFSTGVLGEIVTVYCEYLLSVLEFGKYEVKIRGLYCRCFCGRSRKVYWCTLIWIWFVCICPALTASIRPLLSARTVLWALWMERLRLLWEIVTVFCEWVNFQGPTISFGGMGLLIKVVSPWNRCWRIVDALLMT